MPHPKGTRKPDPDFDPQTMKCMMCLPQSQRMKEDGPRRRVVGVWDQPQHFADPSTVFYLECGHEVF